MAHITNGVKEPGIPLRRAGGLLLVMETPKGRGVFASQDIPARTILEVSPVLVLDPRENEEHIKKTELYNYTYNWPYTPHTTQNQSQSQSQSHNNTSLPTTTTQAIILGLGSMFNHSSLSQNVGWERDLKNLLVTYTALRDISIGDELCISYGPRLTFRDLDAEGESEGEADWTEHMDVIDLIA